MHPNLRKHIQKLELSGFSYEVIEPWHIKAYYDDGISIGQFDIWSNGKWRLNVTGFKTRTGGIPALIKWLHHQKVKKELREIDNEDHATRATKQIQ